MNCKPKRKRDLTPFSSRRSFCKTASAIAAGAVLPGWLQAAVVAQPQRILLRSSWQVANIGDLSHTPGVLALLERYLPNTQVRLWASYDFSVEATAMCKRRFPNFQVAKGLINSSGRANNPALQDALDWCDFCMDRGPPWSRNET
jgi:hypothetical protein